MRYINTFSVSILCVYLFSFSNYSIAQNEIVDRHSSNSERITSNEKLFEVRKRNQGKKIGWSPSPLYDQEMVYDRCDDNDAIASGLDGGELKESRERLGLDCEKGTGLRYAHVSKNGGFVLSETPSPPIDKSIVELEGTGISGELIDESDNLLGYLGPNFQLMEIPINSDGKITALPDSIHSNDGITYGLAVNLTQFLAESVTVSIGNNEYRYPLSVQSGEIFPFSLNAEKSVFNLDELSFDATFSNNHDIDRSILVSGSPGHWTGPADKLPEATKSKSINRLTSSFVRNDRPISIFQTSLELVIPTTTTEITDLVRKHVVQNIEVVVGLFDYDNNLIEIITPEIFEYTVDDNDVAHIETKKTLQMHEILLTSFEIPDNVLDFGIWVGGT